MVATASSARYGNITHGNYDAALQNKVWDVDV
jgi:hypothetical protein